MTIALDKVKVTKRIRKRMGDIAGLAKNIAAVGLIHPLTVMADEDGEYRFLAGYRRLPGAIELPAFGLPQKTWPIPPQFF